MMGCGVFLVRFAGGGVPDTGRWPSGDLDSRFRCLVLAMMSRCWVGSHGVASSFEGAYLPVAR
jgi:hypothetical protein